MTAINLDADLHTLLQCWGTWKFLMLIQFTNVCATFSVWFVPDNAPSLKAFKDRLDERGLELGVGFKVPSNPSPSVILWRQLYFISRRDIRLGVPSRCEPNHAAGCTGCWLRVQFNCLNVDIWICGVSKTLCSSSLFPWIWSSWKKWEKHCYNFILLHVTDNDWTEIAWGQAYQTVGKWQFLRCWDGFAFS